MKTLLSTLLLILVACASTPPPLEEPLRVLILGDSISIGYTPHVRELLEGRAQVWRPMRENGKSPENCAGTNHGVERLEAWLAIDGGDWDVIHFNFGLHDLKRVDPETGRNSKDAAHPHQAGPERYRSQLQGITERLGETGARLVFATTTPVPEQVGGPVRMPQDPITYNRVALEVMHQAGVRVDDLYGFALPRLEQLQRTRDVHFVPEGSQALAGEVARSILAAAGLR